ncbi:MAG: hypothetical protein ABUS56_11970, partial [Acidobacteriota bacterium]
MNRTSGPMLSVMLGAAAVTGQFVSAKATRDALFLSAVDATALPAMLVATSVCSMLLVVAHDRWAGKLAPATLVPAAFVVSGALFLVEWLVRAAVPAATAVVLYLHISGGGPLLASGFWLLATERFDPRTAKARFGQIAGAGTLGGVLGGLLSERVAAVFGAPAMLVVLAALQLVAAWLVTRFAASLAARPVRPAGEGDPVGAHQSGWRVVAQAPHLRQLGALVLLGTTGAALLEYLFKLEAVDTLGRGDRLLRFFA